MTLTHSELCARAVRWLEKSKGCSVVFSETHAACCLEIPDAIGWKYGTRSYLVECKTSRSDFAADRAKIFRIKPEKGMGRERYFLVPDGLISPDELPAGWGLLYVKEKSIRIAKAAEVFPVFDRAAEIGLLVSGLRRMSCAIGKPVHEVIREDNAAIRASQPHRLTAAQLRLAEKERRAKEQHNLSWLLSLTPASDCQ